MTILHNEKIMCASGEMNTLPKMFKCVKTHDSKVCDLVGSTNRERRRVAHGLILHMYLRLVNTARTVIVSCLSVPIHLHLVYVITIYVRRYILLANICNEYARQSLKHI